ncbi:glycosyltransferase family 2 protein [Paenibacillus soyae]|uniref:Glycosyltransferase n=1 Tax=Paenibacillus soyae TaxID=2969249 RepID=A0A9X2S6Z6_9BACL|nr:glycosyltransferase family 2 protein [Paenibacillus soyae]MCR2802520.1 glycosyltransferase [Paenibacillus soyae]
MSKISVIVPVHNAGSKLRRCIRSIRAQSFSDWSLILIDDGSTDGSYERCKSYQAKDGRIQMHSQQRMGSMAARKKGIELAASPYVAFLDSDDWIGEHALRRLYETAVRSGADIVVSEMTRVAGSFGLLRKVSPSPYCQAERVLAEPEIRSELVPAFLHGHPFPVQFHGKLYKRELLREGGSYSSRVRFFGDDLFFNLEMFLKAGSIHLLPERHYYYRIGGATSRYMPHLFEDMVNGYRIQKEVIEAYYRQEDQISHLFGARVMLLNTLMTCVHYLFFSSLSKEERHRTIKRYCNQLEVLDCANDEKAAGSFCPDFIRSILQADCESLYRLGKTNYFKAVPRRLIMKAVASLSF